MDNEPVYQNLNVDDITNALKHSEWGSSGNSRQMSLYTGPYGFDMFDEAVQTSMFGTKRLYIGKKVMRILHRTGMGLGGCIFDGSVNPTIFNLLL